MGSHTIDVKAAAFGTYNTPEEVDALVKAIKEM
jgi:selenocysteine lyase/cysteine desulfurase